MATTSPDNLRSPNPTDPYNLVADWAISMNDVQTALNKRGNQYIGTSAQRTAFTTAPEGTHWQDTNGTRLAYVRKSNVWEPLVPNLGVSEIRAGSYSAATSYVTVNFSPAFPSGTTPFVTAQIISGSGSAVGATPAITSVSNTGFSSRVSSGGPFPVHYIAVAR